ncbi:aminoacyltransferase [Enterococcus canis]|nr:aminoacyltransferase [Enterococcus canis]
MYQFKIGIDPKTHDAFVANHPLCSLLQSSAWVKIKDNWGSELVGVYENDQLVASALVLIKRLPLGFTMLYTPRGPIMDYQNTELVQFFLTNLKKYGKKQRGLFLKMDPGVHYHDFHVGEEPLLNPEAPAVLEALAQAGAKHQGFTMAMDATIQPRFQANIYQADFSEEQLSKKTRKWLNTARKKGVYTEFVGVESVNDFAKIMAATTERKHISLRNADYFQKLLTTYPDNSFITLARLDQQKLYDETKARFDKATADLAACPPNAAKKRHNLEELLASLTREVTELEERIATDGPIATVAGALTLTFGSTSEILYAGMDDRFKRYMPAYLTWFDTIQACFDRGCTSCNMGGLDGSLNDGLIQFKQNFNPTINELIGEFDLPVNKVLFSLSETAYKLRKAKH